MNSPARRVATLAGLWLVAAAGCASAPSAPAIPPTDPQGAAAAVVGIAGDVDFDDERLAALFGDLDDDARVDLLDALAALRPASAPRVMLVEPLDGLARTHVEAVVTWGDSGEAELALQVEPAANGTLRVRWFQGPGVEWPEPSRSRDGGVTTSAPPGGA